MVPTTNSVAAVVAGRNRLEATGELKAEAAEDAFAEGLAELVAVVAAEGIPGWPTGRDGRRDRPDTAGATGRGCCGAMLRLGWADGE